MQEIYIGNGATEYHLHSLSQILPSIVFRGLEGLEGPEVRVDRYDNPGIRGATVAQLLPGGRLITLEGALHSPGGATSAEQRANYLAERRALIAAITSRYDVRGRVIPLTLRLTDLDGREYRVSVTLERPLKAARELPTRNEWNLSLYNASGVIESASATTGTVTLPQDGGVVFDLVWDIVFGASAEGSLTLTNQGSAQAEPVITLYGPLPNPRITNTATGEFIALNHTLLAGDVITIDCANNTIVQGANTNRMGTRLAGSTLWAIQPGPNTITLSASSYAAGYATVTFHHAWEGL